MPGRTGSHFGTSTASELRLNTFATHAAIRKIAAVGSISAGTALAVMDGGIANVALPTIAHDLHVDSSSTVSIVTVYQWFLLVALLPLSAFGDRIGLKRLLKWGHVAFVVASILPLFADSLGLLLAARALQSIAAAAVLSVTSGMLRSFYSSAALGRGLGFNSVIVSSATVSAPLLGGAVLSWAPWQWLFVAPVPLSFLALSLSWALPDPQPHRAPFDFRGAVLCGFTFGLIVAGLELAVRGSSRLATLLVLAGVAAAIALIRNQRRQPRPILPVDLLADVAVARSALSALTVFAAAMIVLVSLPFRLESTYGFSAQRVGTVMSPWPIATLLVAPLAGTLADRYSARLLGTIGLAIAAVALTLLSVMPLDSGDLDIAWRLALCGAGVTLFLQPNARLIIGVSPPDRAASAGGLLSTIRLCGQTLGGVSVAACLALHMGAGQVPTLAALALALAALVFTAVFPAAAVRRISS